MISKIDGILKDLNHPLEKDCRLELFTGESSIGHNTLLHSTAHLMAQAVKYFYPHTKVAIGPTIDNGFYYDFDVDIPFTEDVLTKIELKMKDYKKRPKKIERTR